MDVTVQPPDAIETEFLCDVRVTLTPAQDIGQTPAGRRMVLIVRSGSFEGPRLRGEILPGGGDWLVMLANGVAELDIRASFRAHDGALILAKLTGVIDAAPAVFLRAVSGQPVDASEYYLRVTPRFETADERYAWLNRLVCVGTGAFGQHQAAFRMYALT